MNIRPSAVAGTLYEADTQRLLAQVESWLENDTGDTTPRQPKAIIVPHSGYHYSGETASKAFQLLEPFYDKVRRVVVLGTSHRDSFTGIALPGTELFRTPIGDVPIDDRAVHELLQIKGVTELPDAHRLEHSIEVQLPFLQTALEDFHLVPLIVGHCNTELVVKVLEALWEQDDTLVVISTGLSRKLPHQQAVDQDTKSAENIRAYRANFTYDQACGFTALNGFLEFAKDKNLDSKCVALTTSADKNGQRENVRGFGSFVFY